MDVPSQIREDDMVFDVFLIYRTHLTVKSIADNIKNTPTFERSVLSGVLNIHFRHVKQATDLAGLRGTIAPMPGYRNVFLADRLEYFALQDCHRERIC